MDVTRAMPALTSFTRAFVTGGSGFVGGQLLRELVRQQVPVVALARSEAAASKVMALGATSVLGDLDDETKLVSDIGACDVVFHSAANVGHYGNWERDFVRVNVTGTGNLLRAAAKAGVRKFVHISTEAVLVGAPIINADETQPYSKNIFGMYPRSKAMAEREVLSANSTMQTVVIRPRFIWGLGDQVLLPNILQTVRSGDFKWIDRGNFKTSVTNVKNVVEGVILAAEKGRGGEIYFITDGEQPLFRDFVTRLVATQNVDCSHIGSIPRWLAAAFAWASETAHDLLPLSGMPTLVPFIVEIIGQEVTVNDGKARRELGYTAHISVEQGMQELVDEFNKKQPAANQSA